MVVLVFSLSILPKCMVSDCSAEQPVDYQAAKWSRPPALQNSVPIALTRSRVNATGRGRRVPLVLKVCPLYVGISSIQIIDRFNTNQALILQCVSYLCIRVAILKAAKKGKTASRPKVVTSHCSTAAGDKRFGSTFFYLVSRTRIPSVHEPDRELNPFALPDNFFTDLVRSRNSVGGRGLLQAQAGRDLTEPCMINAILAQSTIDGHNKAPEDVYADGCGGPDERTGLLTFFTHGVAWRS